MVRKLNRLHDHDLTACYSTMFEQVAHGLFREKTLQHSETVAKMFDWSAVMGF